MELHLDRQNGEKRLLPMVKLASMRTRHDELMLQPEEKETAAALRSLAAQDEKEALEKALAWITQDAGAEQPADGAEA
ncbi:MAG: hypothetical protein E7324_10585 [Clostridiales bacterium]|nr:hypothetical protein [Clostridiales bacterium]